MKNKIESIYDKFLNRIHKDRPGDAPIIVGIEFIFVYIALRYKFIDSHLSEILEIESHNLFLFINIGLSFVLLIGLIITLCGIATKWKKS